MQQPDPSPGPPAPLPGVVDRFAGGGAHRAREAVAYAERTGAPNPDFFYLEEAEDNFTLGAWVNSRHKEHHRGDLSPARVAALEAIQGWEWRPFDAAWHRMYQRLAHEADQYGNITHLTQRSLVDGAPVGRWIMTQRGAHRRGQLTPARTHALEAIPGWNWAPRTPTPTEVTARPHRHAVGTGTGGGYSGFAALIAAAGASSIPAAPVQGGEGHVTTSTDEVVFVHVFEECAVE